MKIGDRVVLRETSRYYRPVASIDSRNPIDIRGTIISNYAAIGSRFQWYVRWNNKTYNVYETKDLKVVRYATRTKTIEATK